MKTKTTATYVVAESTQVEDHKIGNRYYNVQADEEVELIDDDGDIATIKLKSGEIANIESWMIIEA